MKKLFVLLTLCALAAPVQAMNLDQAGVEEAPAVENTQPAQPAAVQNGCADDPRLPELATLLENGPITPKLTLTAETYMLMDAEVMALLGGQAVICPNIGLLKSGKTVSKVPVDFSIFWDRLTTLANEGDVERIKALRSAFIAKPLSPKEIMRYATPLGLDNKVANTLLKGIGMPANEGNTDGRLGDKLQYPILSVFTVLGGKSTEATDVVVATDSDSRLIALLTEKGIPFAVVPKHPTDYVERVENAVSKAGLTVVPRSAAEAKYK